MSTFICRIAITDASAIAIIATTIVIGRRMAVNTSHMIEFSRSTVLPPGSVEKWRQIAVRLRRCEQRTPYAQPGHRVVSLGLREQPLGFRNFGDAGQAVLIPRASLTLARRRCFAFDRRVLRNLGRRLEERPRFHILGRQR